MSKYAPAREDGTKPYVVTVSRWGVDGDRLVYVKRRGGARYAATGRSQHTYTYMKACRRALPEDVTNLEEYR